jgi:hypothetical protein
VVLYQTAKYRPHEDTKFLKQFEATVDKQIGILMRKFNLQEEPRTVTSAPEAGIRVAGHS